MRKKYIQTNLLCFMISFFGITAQEKQIEKADENFNEYAYIDARKAYLEVVEKGYTSQDIYEKLADSYYFNANLEEASKWYSKLYDEYRGEVKSEYLFRYSHTLKNLKKYKESDKIMLEFDKKIGRNDRRSKLFKRERNYLELIEKQSNKFEIYNSSINSSASDFGPSFYKKEAVFFASNRVNGPLNAIHEWNESPFLDLYKSNRNSLENTKLDEVSEVKGKINTKFHESSTVFTKDGQTMYFTRNNYTNRDRKSDNNGTTKLKLYKAILKKDRWVDIKELPFNSDEYSVAHPALSVDESKLYFASDMPGTKGLSDLFVVNIIGEDEFSEPKNLGGTINTEGRETFPFISNKGDLFFASDGHVGLGGLDIFVSKSIGRSIFKEPYNLGTPINSSSDDFTFIIDNNKKGYFTSNRPGGKGDDDIYSLIQKKELITSCNQYLSGVVTDAETRELLAGAKVTIYDNNMRLLEKTIADANASYSLNIDCAKKYVIRAEKSNYKPTEIDFETNNLFEYKHNQPIQLRKGTVGLNVVEAKIGDDLAKILQLNPIYFDFDKSFIRPDAEIELQKVIAVMNEYPTMLIDVRSHTDSRAPFDYNIHLSTRRNKSTIAYLIEKGNIDKSRLTGRGYGESVLTNNCIDGVECTEEEHQANRRSEFIILKK